MPEPVIAAPARMRDVKPANKRGAARLAAVQALYQMEVAEAGLNDVVAEYENLRLGQEVDGDQYLAADAAWFRSVVAGVVQGQLTIDPVIHSALPATWPLARIDTLMRAVLRAAVFELKQRRDVPARVIINEYVDVAKAFFAEDEAGMINGVLDRIARQERAGELPDVAGEG